MKLRLGFVSNSSSASFVLHTKFSKDEIIEILCKELPKLFNKDEVLKDLEGEIKRHRVSIKENLKSKESEKSGGLYDLWIGQSKSAIKDLQHQKKILKKKSLSKANLVRAVCVFNGIAFNVNQMEKACFSGWTTMWNGDEDMGELLLAIQNVLEKNYGSTSYMLTVDSDE